MKVSRAAAVLSIAGALLLCHVPGAMAASARQDRSVATKIDDSWITTKVTTQFVGVDELAGSNINVDTVQGVVTLTGTVRSQAGREKAMTIARQTDGVKNVMDKMSIAAAASTTDAAREAARETSREVNETTQNAGGAVTDSWITTKLKAQFVPEDSLSGSDISVDTKNGVVTLTGTVKSDMGRKRAVEIAKETDGVKNVVDRMRITGVNTGNSVSGAAERAATRTEGAAERTGEAVTDGWITAKVKSQFIGVDELAGSDINVDTTNGVVTLKGSVKSAAGKMKAETIAKATDGVKSVSNQLVSAAK